MSVAEIASAWLRPVHSVPLPDPTRWSSHGRPLTALALGETVVFAGDGGGQITSWNRDGEPAGTWSAHTARVTVLHCESNWLFSASDDGSAAIWDAGSRAPIAYYRDHPAGVRDLLWDGEHLLTLGRDGRVIVRTLGDEPDILELPEVTAFASSDGRLLIATAERELILLGEHEPTIWSCPEPIGIVAFDGQATFAATPAGLHVWREDGSHRNIALAGISDLTVAGPELIVACAHRVLVLDTATLQELRAFYGHERTIASIGIDRAGRIWSASADRRIRRWHPNESQIPPPMRQCGPVRTLCSDGTVVVSGGRDSAVYTWDPRSAALLQRIRCSDGSVEALCISKRWLVAGYSDGTLAFQDRHESEPFLVRECPAAVTSAVFIDDGRVVIGARDGFLRTYNCADGTCIASWPAHPDRVRSLAHANGILAAASYDHTVSLWRGGNCIGRIADHEAAVTRVAFRSDGVLASGSMDGTVRVYAHNGAPLATLADHEGGATAVVWTPDGLVTAEKAGRIRLWSPSGNVVQCHALPGTAECLIWSDGHLIAGDGAGNLWVLFRPDPHYSQQTVANDRG